MAKTHPSRRRMELRDREFGEESWGRVWKSAAEGRGFTCLPRTFPVLAELAHSRAVTGGRDCRGALLELYSRDWGEAIIEVLDEESHALRAGYASSRAVRTWRERIELLERAGFIEVRPKSVRRFGYILLVHPDQVITELRARRKVPDRLWLAYAETCREFGVTAPADPLSAGPRALDSPTAKAAGSGGSDIPF
jgi:hypothetical protein